MLRPLHKSALAVAAFSLTACGTGESDTFTLYRNSVLGEHLRVHVATFDAAEGEQYNRQNCEIAAGLFKAPGVTVRYWCEKGRFKK